MQFSKRVLLTVCACFLVTSCKESTVIKEEVKQVPASREERILSYAGVVKKVAPAVVNIFAFHHENVKLPTSPFMDDPFFRQFFEHLHREHGSNEDSLGSGVIVSKDGFVLTNYHVIENADVVKVALPDKREYIAKIITIDKRTDLALLKIEDHGDFPYLPVSSQENIEVGDIVLAIGNPFGVGQTVTSGIISALARSEEGINDFRTFIQTDAAINPGNSGGPLVTTDGQLIGINTAIFSKSGGSMGIGFAIPINLAIPVIESANHGGHIVRPWMGVKIQAVTSEDVQALGLDRPYGVLIREVYPGGPADKAGLKVGDFLGYMDGHQIEDDANLNYFVGIAPLGKTVEFNVIRKGDKMKIPVVLTEPLKAKDSTPTVIEGKSPLSGAKISEISPALAIDMQLNPWDKGVVITDILQTAPAAQIGIQTGDILESINEQKVKTKEDVVNLLQSGSQDWSFVLRRGEQVLTIQVKG